jgi:hypothetical protein
MFPLKKISTRYTSCLAITLIMLVSSSIWAQGQKTTRSIQSPRTAAYCSLVPAAWKDQLVELPQAQNIPNVSILFKPAAGDEFEVLVSAFAAQGAGPLGSEQLRQQFSAMMMQKLQSMAAEKQLNPQKLSGPGVSGTYVSITDKRLKEGERKKGDFRYVTQGEMVLSNMLVTFTIFSHDRQAAAVQEALEMWKHAKRG